MKAARRKNQDRVFCMHILYLNHNPSNTPDVLLVTHRVCYNKNMYRQYPLVTGSIHHIVNKSIAGFRILNHDSDYQRMLNLMRYFALTSPPMKFSYFLKDIRTRRLDFASAMHNLDTLGEQQVQLIAYCLMPTHFHIIVKQLGDKGVTEYMRKVQNGYARYFNVKYKRQGTLWMSRFKNVLIGTDEQLNHVIRYIHLNPVTAGLVEKPADWSYSSYSEYVSTSKVEYPISSHDDLIGMTPNEIITFTAEQVDLQKELALIKYQVIE